MQFTIDKAKDIKLIVWDLDETFWEGTLSDNLSTIKPSEDNIALVKGLTNRGIVNSICSKNDESAVLKELEKLELKDYFVFNSINWEPKGPRLKSIVEDIGLRSNNVLFIDDNTSNLAEAEYIMPNIMVSTPEITGRLLAIVDSLGKNDSKHDRLNQYHLLENKRIASNSFDSSKEFLEQSNIVVTFQKVDGNNIQRIEELIQRTNQLNYTKKRIKHNELVQLLDNKDYESSAITVRDKYGDYGIVGFYALNKNKFELDHFLFSCRTLGMGIEQFVYAYLDYPVLKVVPPVSGVISDTLPLPDYISLDNNISSMKTIIDAPKSGLRVLLKGPCDLEVMASYLINGDVKIDTEFNYIDKNGNQADYYNHTVNILNSVVFSSQEISEWCSKYSFLDSEAFSTNIFSGNYDVICFSPLMDATLAVYDDITGKQLAYGLSDKPLTDSKYHLEYIDKEVMTARSNFLKGELDSFSENFRQIEFTPNMILNNINHIINNIVLSNPDVKIVLILLSELPYESSQNELFYKKELLHKAINELIRNKYSNSDNVYLLDVNRYINSQSDYFDNINHYSKWVYYQMANEFVDYLKNNTKLTMNTKSKIYAIIQNLKRLVYKKLFLRYS